VPQYSRDLYILQQPDGGVKYAVSRSYELRMGPGGPPDAPPLLGQGERCIATVSWQAPSHAVISNEFSIRVDVLRASDKLPPIEATLTDLGTHAFDVKLEEVRNVSGALTWIWNVIPRRKGDASLDLDVIIKPDTRFATRAHIATIRTYAEAH